MAQVQGYEFPEDRFYDVENQIWYLAVADGNVGAGFTTWATTLMGDVLVFTPKRIGHSFERGKWFAMVEGGKWVGAAKAAFNGVVVVHNEALIDKPEILSADAFGAGWMIVLKPDDAGWRDTLTAGDKIAAEVEAWIGGGSFRQRSS
ncbi:MAG: glycine cleavage system protein H [Pseudolabrys sp.]|jgi:glycine cleavage system H protein